MDEILIEEKRYVSSKRAAKMTGYAKDYVGQLCREGRVPARLVGRSWYVLESAIQDHRFGNPEQKTESTESKQESVSRWESPHYEATTAEILPSINRLRDSASSESNDQEEASEPLHDSWRAWFDRVTDSATTPIEQATSDAIETDQEAITEGLRGEEERAIEVEEGISVPIHTVYELPPEDLLPQVTRQHDEIREPRQEPEKVFVQRGMYRAARAFQLVGVVVAVLAVGAAALGSGYFDKYILSNSQVGIIAGVGLYNR